MAGGDPAAGRSRSPTGGRPGGPREGGYSVVEAAITLPVVILLSMLVVQWALVWHGRHVAEAAAQTGLRHARGYQATAAAGQQAAVDYLHNVAPRLLPSSRVDVTRTPTTVSVHVHAEVLPVIPGLSGLMAGSIDQSVSGPVERFVG